MMLEVSVIVASIGRPENITALLKQLEQQTQLPARVILSMETEADAPPEADHPFPVERVYGPRGSSVQRNRGLDLLGAETDLVVFYDDDFVPSKFAVEGVERVFRQLPDIAGATGEVLADGIQGEGISPEDAAAFVAKFDAERPAARPFVKKGVSGLYGCNMAYRVSSIGGNRFDESLPLYGWLEDVDFSAGLKGPLVWTNAFSGVHCGEKRGREKSGVRLGYSQVVNPAYLVRKGNLSRRRFFHQACGLILKNVIRTFAPEPWIDRKGRLKGNLLGLRDLMSGKINPSRILDL